MYKLREVALPPKRRRKKTFKDISGRTVFNNTGETKLTISSKPNLVTLLSSCFSSFSCILT